MLSPTPHRPLPRPALRVFARLMLAVACALTLAACGSTHADMRVCLSGGQAPQRAVAACTRLIERPRLWADPSLADWYAARAAHRRAQDDTAGEIEDLDAAIALAPQNPMLYLRRSNARDNVADHEGARMDAELADRLMPIRRAEVDAKLARNLRRQGSAR